MTCTNLCFRSSSKGGNGSDLSQAIVKCVACSPAAASASRPVLEIDIVNPDPLMLKNATKGAQTWPA